MVTLLLELSKHKKYSLINKEEFTLLNYCKHGGFKQGLETAKLYLCLSKSVNKSILMLWGFAYAVERSDNFSIETFCQ